MQVLYESDLLRREILFNLARVARDPHAEPLDAFARGLVAGVAERRDEIDAAIGQHARGWSVTRMPVVDRNILRLAVYELLHSPDTPPAVVIDEAVELAKALSTDDSPRYVNGVLSAILRNLPQLDHDQDARSGALGEATEAGGEVSEVSGREASEVSRREAGEGISREAPGEQ